MRFIQLPLLEVKSLDEVDPFFALGYNADIEFEAEEIPSGIGAHPHKGFETVTLA